MKLIPSSIKAASLAVCLISAASLAQAQVISVNFAGTHYNYPDTAPYEYFVESTAGVVATADWTNFTAPGELYGSGLFYFGANPNPATSAYINYTSGNDHSVWGLNAESSTIIDANAGIYNNYLNYFGNGGQIYFGQLGSEFTSQGYDVIVYFTNAFNSTIHLSLYEATVQDRYAQVVAGTPFNGFVASNATTAGGATVANYVRFTGLTQAGFGLFGSGDTAAPSIAAIQIVAVPEPSTIALAVLGTGAVLVMYRRRQAA